MKDLNLRNEFQKLGSCQLDEPRSRSRSVRDQFSREPGGIRTPAAPGKSRARLPLRHRPRRGAAVERLSFFIVVIDPLWAFVELVRSAAENEKAAEGLSQGGSRSLRLFTGYYASGAFPSKIVGCG